MVTLLGEETATGCGGPGESRTEIGDDEKAVFSAPAWENYSGEDLLLPRSGLLEL